MEMKRVSILILISIIEICHGQNSNESAYGCDDFYCLTGTVKLVSLESSDNDWISVNRQGENYTVTLKRPLDWENGDYANYYYTTRENPEPELTYAVNSICARYLSQGSLEDEHLLRSKLVTMLIPWYQQCPIPAGQYTPILGFEGGFSLTEQPPSCDEFNATVTFGEALAYENFTVKMVVNVMPDNALECYREVTSTSDTGLVVETEKDSQPGSEVTITDGQLGPEGTTEMEYEPVSEVITTESSEELQAYGCDGKYRYCYTGTVSLASLVSTDNEWISVDGEGENITMTLKKSLSWGIDGYVNYFYTTPSNPEPQYSYSSTPICGSFFALDKEDRHLLITQLLTMLFPDYKQCPIPAGQYTPLHRLQGGFSLFDEAPSCEEFNMIMVFGASMQERVSYEDADLIFTAKVDPDNALDCYRKPIPTSLPEPVTEPESETGSQPGSIETETNSQPGSGETTKSQPGLGETITESEPGTGETTTKSQPGWEETTTKSQAGLGDTTESQPELGETTPDSQAGWEETTTESQSGLGETTESQPELGETTPDSQAGWEETTTKSQAGLGDTTESQPELGKTTPDSQAGWEETTTKSQSGLGDTTESQPGLGETTPDSQAGWEETTADSQSGSGEIGILTTVFPELPIEDMNCLYIYRWFSNMTAYPSHYYRNWYNWGMRKNCFPDGWSYESVIAFLRSRNSRNNGMGLEGQQPTDSEMPDAQLGTIINCPDIYGWFTDLKLYPAHYYKNWYDWGVRNECFTLDWSYESLIDYLRSNNSENDEKGDEEQETTGVSTAPGLRLGKIINCLYVYGWFTDLTIYPAHYYKNWYDWGVRNYCFPLGWSYEAVLLYIGGNTTTAEDPTSEAMEITNTEPVDG